MFLPKEQNLEIQGDPEMHIEVLCKSVAEEPVTVKKKLVPSLHQLCLLLTNILVQA
jgi:hypothetical protein